MTRARFNYLELFDGKRSRRPAQKCWSLFSHIGTWIQGDTARTHFNALTHADDRYAAKWDVVGALLRCYPKFEDFEINYEKLNYHTLLVHGLTLELWNDHPDTTYRHVVDLLKALDI